MSSVRTGRPLVVFNIRAKDSKSFLTFAKEEDAFISAGETELTPRGLAFVPFPPEDGSAPRGESLVFRVLAQRDEVVDVAEEPEEAPGLEELEAFLDDELRYLQAVFRTIVIEVLRCSFELVSLNAVGWIREDCVDGSGV